MERDMDYVRALLFELKNGNYIETIYYRTEEGAKYKYHLDILRDAGFIEFKNYKPAIAFIPLDSCPRITWHGNEFLDVISEDTVWNRTKDKIKQRSVDLSRVSFGIVRELATLELKKHLGI